MVFFFCKIPGFVSSSLPRQLGSALPPGAAGREFDEQLCKGCGCCGSLQVVFPKLDDVVLVYESFYKASMMSLHEFTGRIAKPGGVALVYKSL